jgi:hypothetical protein
MIREATPHLHSSPSEFHLKSVEKPWKFLRFLWITPRVALAGLRVGTA